MRLKRVADEHGRHGRFHQHRSSVPVPNCDDSLIFVHDCASARGRGEKRARRVNALSSPRRGAIGARAHALVSATEREPERDAARLELPPALALRPSKATSPEVFDGLSMLRAATAAYGDTPASKLRGWPRAPPPARAEKHALAHRFLARTQQGPRARPPLQRGWGELPSHILL